MEEIERVTAALELENAKRAAADPAVKAALRTVEEFLKHEDVMCYGGTAINNLLPPADRFYNPKTDIPDYDFFSKTPQEHAMKLADKLAAAGIKSVEVKAGMHLGTFKVYADFEGVADITHLNKDIFDRLWKEGLEKNGIHYVTPNFLRMSMYLELSRPRGDVSRWKKVYQRLVLLNKHYPLSCPIAKKEPTPLDDENRKVIESLLLRGDVILLGLAASQVHEGKRSVKWSAPATIMTTEDKVEGLTKGYKTKEVEGTDILPSYTNVYDAAGKVFLRIHQTAACHSYHQMRSGVRVASIPTLLQFFFAFMYSGATEDEISELMCVSQRLMDLAHEKPKRRYALLTPTDCVGHQENLVEIRKNKAVMYEKLGKNKSSSEFLQYFFSYNPHDDVTKRNKAREQLRKTRKARMDASY
jgi:Poly(A) polymerase catalytic subunit